MNMCKNCTDHTKAQSDDLSESNSLPTDCTKTPEKRGRDKFGDAQGDNKGDGCEYCRDGKKIQAEEDWLENNSFSIIGHTLIYGAYVDDAGGSFKDEARIAYCPMCGRKL